MTLQSIVCSFLRAISMKGKPREQYCFKININDPLSVEAQTFVCEANTVIYYVATVVEIFG